MIVAVTDLDKIPEKCLECPFFTYEADDYGYCPITEEQMDCDEMKFRSYGCPLKEVPDNALSTLRQ